MAIDQERPSLTERLRSTREEVSGLGAEVAEIASDLRLLAQKEVELGVAEVQEQIGYAAKGAGLGVVTFLLADMGAIFAFLTLMFALDTFLPLWAAALITTLLILVLAGLALAMTLSQFKKLSLKPRRFLNSLQEDMEWARTQMRSSAR